MNKRAASVFEWDRDALLQSPLFAPLHPELELLSPGKFPGLEDCNALLPGRDIVVQNGTPLRFVAQEYGKLPFESQYEPRCYLRGEVQTREHNWHDFFNALVWLVFPRTKAAINARHFLAQTGEREGGGSQRGAVRDMNTLFDESGVVVVCADKELAALLREFKWRELFWEQRERVRSAMAFILFGHGLYEKAMHPYIGLTGQGLVLETGREFFAWEKAQQRACVDELLAAYLSDARHCRSTRELTPLPLLGVPGWDAANEFVDYYGNTHYFRPGRRGGTGSV